MRKWRPESLSHLPRFLRQLSGGKEGFGAKRPDEDALEKRIVGLDGAFQQPGNWKPNLRFSGLSKSCAFLFRGQCNSSQPGDEDIKDVGSYR